MQNRSKFMICKWRRDHWSKTFLRLIKPYILNLKWSPKSKLKNSHSTTTTRSMPATLPYGPCLGETQSESGELCGCSTCRFVLQIGFHDFIKAGQNSWTFAVDNRSIGRIVDVIFFKIQIYAVSIHGSTVSLDVYMSDSHSPPPKLKLLTLHYPSGKLRRAYLVESTKGDLLQVQRFYGPTKITD